MGAVNRPKIQMGLLSAEDTHHGSLSRLPGLRIGARRAFSLSLVGRQWHVAADSPLTVTGSLGICTRFPFTPTARLGTEGLIFVYALSYQPIRVYVNGRRKNSRLRKPQREKRNVLGEEISEGALLFHGGHHVPHLGETPARITPHSLPAVK